MVSVSRIPVPSTDAILPRLQKLTETKLVAQILIPLFEAMGFDSVENNHGPLDRGKDILAVKRDEFGISQLTVASVKRCQFSGKATRSSHLTTICTQLTQCINEPVRMKDGVERSPAAVWFISPFPLTPTSLELSFRSYSQALANRVKIIDGPMILSAVRERCPSLLSSLGDTLTIYLGNIKKEIPLLHEAAAFGLKEAIPLEKFYVDLSYVLKSLYDKAWILPLVGLRSISVKELAVEDFHSLVKLDAALRGALGVGLFPTVQAARRAQQTLRRANSYVQNYCQQTPNLDARTAVNALKGEYRALLASVDKIFRGKSTKAEKMASLERVVEWGEGTYRIERPTLRLVTREPKKTKLSAPETGPRLNLSMDELIRSRLSLIVRGHGGSGKTTLLRVAAARLAETAERIPIYAPLSSVRSNDALEDELHASCGRSGFKISQRGLRDLLNEGRVVVLLDGMDEIVGKFSKFGLTISIFATKFPKCQVIVSTRPWVIEDLPPSFLRVDLEPFTDKQVREFFGRWFSDSPSNYEAVMRHIERHEGLHEVVKTPLIASILAALRQAGGKLPESLTGVYRERLRLLLHDWSAVKGINRDVYDPTDKRYFLRKMAYALQAKREVAAPWLKWHQAVRRFVGNVIPPAQASAFLRELVESNNVLVQRRDGLWGLGHLQHQEYLAALELAENRDLSVVDKIGSEWWSEVLNMYAELVQDVASVIRQFATDSKRFNYNIDQLYRMVMRAPHTALMEKKRVENEYAAQDYSTNVPPELRGFDSALMETEAEAELATTK